MPWFQCPARSQSNLEAVKETLTDDFMGKGIRHDDVAWRNVGVYRQGGQTKAVVFDMQKVYCVEKHEKEDWVTPAVARLSKKKGDTTVKLILGMGKNIPTDEDEEALGDPASLSQRSADQWNTQDKVRSNSSYVIQCRTA
jgi:hypothetical protein